MSDALGCVFVVFIVVVLATGGAFAIKGCEGTTSHEVTVTKTVPVSQKVANIFKKDKTETEEEVVVREFEQEPAVAAKPKLEAPDFTYGTPSFWVLAAIVVIILFACIEYEQGIAGAVCLLIFLGIVQWAGKSDPLGYVQQHPLNSLLFLVSYYMVGVVWGFIKWYLFLIDKKTEAVEYKEKWLEDNGASDPAKITDALRAKWAGQTYKFAKPTARANKFKIINWISYWPLSVLWSFFADFVKRIGTIIYNHIARSLQAMADRVWKGADLDVI